MHWPVSGEKLRKISDVLEGRQEEFTLISRDSNKYYVRSELEKTEYLDESQDLYCQIEGVQQVSGKTLEHLVSILATSDTNLQSHLLKLLTF